MKKTIDMKLRQYKKGMIPKGTRVLIRIDANVPIKNGRVVSGGDNRIQAVLPELKRLASLGGKIVLMTHVGRPEGARVDELSTKPIADYLVKQIKQSVYHTQDTVGDTVLKRIEEMEPGDVLVLENLRFYAGEQKNAAAFAKKLARLGDIYINNAFGVSHRKHASVHAITRYIDSYAGDMLRREVDELTRPLKQPAVLVIGGIKLKTKIPVIEHLAPAVDTILTAGGIAVALIVAERSKRLSAGGHEISKDELNEAKKILDKYPEKLHLPVDFKISTKKQFDTLTTKDAGELRARDRLFDIGPKSIRHYKELLEGAKFVIWNGPMGLIERTPSAKGTVEIAKAIVSLEHARTIVGGGDTVAFLEKKNLADKFSFISTGGGAMLDFLAGKELPGLEAVRTK